MKLTNLRRFVGALWAPQNLIIVKRAVTTSAFRLVRFVFVVFQTIYWQLNGTSQQVRGAHRPESCDRSAHVLNVLWCHKFCPLNFCKMENFICTHNRFENPQYVFDNDNINLMFISDTHAVFCEPTRKGIFVSFWKFYIHLLFTTRVDQTTRQINKQKRKEKLN